AVLLFGAWSVLRESFEESAAPPPLVTRIVELARPEPAPPEATKPPPRPEAKQPEQPRPVPQPTPAPAAEPQVAPAPVSPSAAPAALQVDTRAAEAATAAQYRMQLIAYAQRNK